MPNSPSVNFEFKNNNVLQTTPMLGVSCVLARTTKGPYDDPSELIQSFLNSKEFLVLRQYQMVLYQTSKRLSMVVLSFVLFVYLVKVQLKVQYLLQQEPKLHLLLKLLKTVLQQQHLQLQRNQLLLLFLSLLLVQLLLALVW